ncbi:PA14 domain-containing protein [Nonlabens agnitus]|uniref:PA14 domain-containing protein n=1 Tax=Nonlabens agnitus TaxID=870484 RepID=A0A2S9WUB0_9FLAO|nr:PA14 domain-containing protein [Nonlabens agnitus]PRP67055.1 hypothetical protein BST86_08045 [Nonlabens agnitus]
MKARLLYSLLIALTSLPIMAQVGINSVDPKATMDIEAIETNSSTAEGLIAPRLTGDQIRDKDAQYGTDQTGTLIYASAAVTSSPSAKTINIDAPGYYFFDGSIWLKVAAGVDDTNLATTNLTQDAETRTYDLNSQDLNFTNGSFGINKPNPNGQLDVEGTRNEDAFRFTQTNNLTGEKDVFTVEDQDIGGGGQDHSSVLKVLKSGSINPGDDGFSLIELASTSSDPGANKYWISGRTVDEGAPFWGVDITDNDFWSIGGIQLGALPSSNGTYTGGYFRVNANGDTGIGTVNPNARLQIDEDSADLDHIIFQINTSSGRPLNILQPDVTDINTPFTFQTNNAFNFRTDNTDALTILNTSQLALPSYVGNFQNETPTRILGLDAAGNVISSSPVSGADGTDDAWVNDPGNSRIILGSQSDGTTARTANTEFVSLDNGNIGVGIDMPTSKMHIVGGSNSPSIGLAESVNLQARLTNPNGGSVVQLLETGDRTIRIGINPTYSLYGGAGAFSMNAYSTRTGEQDSDFISYDFQTERLILLPNTGGGANEVGIGVNEPTAKLHIVPNNGLAALRVEGVTTGSSSDDLMTIDANGVVHKASRSLGQPGMQFYTYAISGGSPDVNNLRTNVVPIRSGSYSGVLNSNTAYTVMAPATRDRFAIKMVGTYEVKNSGNFTFTEVNDDGARIYIDDTLVLNFWTDGANDTNSATVNLAKGKHKIEFWHYENAGGENFRFNWGSNPDGNSGEIRANQFTVE